MLDPDAMRTEDLNQTDCKRLSRGEGGFPARQPCVVPFPTVVERIRLYVEDLGIEVDGGKAFEAGALEA